MSPILTIKKLATEEEQLEKLKTKTLSNLNNLYKILNYNVENKIHFYRITSALVPLATHPEVDNWNYRLIFKKVPPEIGSRLMIENDDKTFTATETLALFKTLKLPMVLDVHHHNCNNKGEKIEDLLEEIMATWDNKHLPPKFHFSSPKECPLDRKHSDFIVAEDFISFIETCKKYDRDIDVMIEAKQKDLALFKLMEDLKRLRQNWTYIDNTTFEVADIR